jgi:hypothetical protein
MSSSPVLDEILRADTAADHGLDGAGGDEDDDGAAGAALG